MPPKNPKLQHYSLSRQNSVKLCKDFTQDRIFFTPTLFARSYVFASLLVIQLGSTDMNDSFGLLRAFVTWGSKGTFTSRSEQAPGSGFHPRDKSFKIDCGFWDLVGAIKTKILEDKYQTDHIKSW